MHSSYTRYHLCIISADLTINVELIKLYWHRFDFILIKKTQSRKGDTCIAIKSTRMKGNILVLPRDKSHNNYPTDKLK